MSKLITDDRSREANGRFASELRSEPRGLQDGGMSNQPSFCFPARYETAADLIEFYERVEVPEITLSNVKYAYQDFREQQVEAQTEEWAHKWEISKDYREWKKGRIAEGIDADMLNFEANLKMETARELFKDEFPMALPPLEIETIARYAQLYSKSGHLSAEELAKVDAHVVNYSGGDQKTVKELADYFQVSPWIRDAATTSDLQVARTSQRSAEMIVKALGQLGR